MELKIFDLGLVDFIAAWQIQKNIFQQVKDNYLDSALIFCRHYPVVTLGRQAEDENILISESELHSRNIGLHKIERGGDVTYHGPGQLTVYPIFNLTLFRKDIHWFLRQLEQVIINSLVYFSAFTQCRKGFTGVWADSRKIASIGIAIRNWITFHGLSINLREDDLVNFKLIRPCGMDIEMTSLEGLLNREVDINEVKNAIIHGMLGTFEIEFKNVLRLEEEVEYDKGNFAGIRGRN